MSLATLYESVKLRLKIFFLFTNVIYLDVESHHGHLPHVRVICGHFKLESTDFATPHYIVRRFVQNVFVEQSKYCKNS